MKHFLAVLFFLLCLILGSFLGQAARPAINGAHPPSPAFMEGERLVYDITYFSAKTGVATFEVKEKMVLKGRLVYPIVLTAQSNDLVSLFYPVDDRVESYMDVEGLYSHHIKIRQHQGRKHRNKVIDFDQAEHRAVQSKNNGQEIFEIPPQVQDTLSALYYLRAVSPLEVGKSTFVNVHESEKNWSLEIKTLKKERVETPVGMFDAIKTQALVRYEGLFMDKGDVFIWFTDDAKRIPVVVKTRIKIGSITATLSSRKDGPI